MITYLILFFFLSLLSLADYIYTPVLYRKIILCIGGISVFIIFWLFASLKWKTGTDWEPYFDTFYYLSEDYEILFEPGYIALVSFVRGLTSNYTVFLTIFCFLCISIKFSFFLKYQKESFFTLVLLFYCYYFADIFAVRQSLAISLTLLSTIFIINRKPILFVLCVALAMSIHTSSILYFFAYFIYWRKISDKSFYYIIFFSVVFGLFGFGGVFLDFFLKLFGLEGLMAEKINNYLSGESEGINANVNPLLVYIFGVIKRLLLIPIFIYIRNESKGKFVFFQGYFNLYMVGNIIYFMFAKDLPVFVRASVPYLFFEMFLISYVMLYFKNKKNVILLVFALLILFSWARFTALVNSYYDLYVPYNSIFDKRIERNSF